MPKKIKIKMTVPVNGIDTEVEREIEVPDEFTDEMAYWPEKKAANGALTVDKAKHIGKRHSRVDGADKVTGRAKYAYDITPKTAPGLLFGRLIVSSRPNARIKSIDTSAAEKIPGVVAVELLVRADGNVTSAGAHIGGVAAETEEAAEDGMRAVKIEYEDREHVVSLDAALREDAPAAFADMVSRPNVQNSGNVDSAFAESDAIVQATYDLAPRVHACLETHGHTVWFKGDSAVVWSSTQNVSGVRGEAARALGLTADKVEVITEFMGGGFGSKFPFRTEGIIAANLSKRTKRPVRMLLTRRQEFQNAGIQPGGRAIVKIGGTKDGMVKAFQARLYGFAGDQAVGMAQIPYIYNFPNRRVESIQVKLNAGAHAAFRAPNHPQACFVTDSAMDELAYKLGVDPVQFRIKNDLNPTRQAQFKLGAKEFGWDARFNKNPTASAGPLKRGCGVAGNTWGGAGNANTPVTVKIYPDGKVEALSGSQDLGTGNRTLLNIIAAEELGLDPKDITSMLGHSTYGPAGGSGGSTTAPSIAPSCKAAVGYARQKMAKALAQVMNVDEKLIAFDNGGVFVKGDATKTMAFKQACAKLKEPIIAEGRWYGIPTLSQGGVAGCQFAEVEVDVETGKVRVICVVCVQDSGLILNHKAWESQCFGGIITGMGMALLEQRVMDNASGQWLNANFDEYKLPMSFDIPDIKVIPYHMPERGVIGIGEPPTISTAAAIANAVYNACGARVRSLPITPDKVLKALDAARTAELNGGVA